MQNVVEEFNGAAAYQMAIRPYRSMSWGAQKKLMGAITLVSAGLAAVFAKAGAGPLAFAFVVPPLGISLALMATNKSAKEYQTLSVEEDDLIVRHYLPGRSKPNSITAMKAGWTNVTLKTSEVKSVEDRILLSTHGKSIEIGQFLPPDQRKLVADRLKQILLDYRKNGKITHSPSPNFMPPPRDRDATLW